MCIVLKYIVPYDMETEKHLTHLCSMSFKLHFYFYILFYSMIKKMYEDGYMML